MKMLVPVVNGNVFEDALNSFLMDVFFGELIAKSPKESVDYVLLGGGTWLASDAIKHIMPDTPRIVFSSGYAKGIPEAMPVDSAFISVRGKITAKFFGLSDDFAHGDAACLVPMALSLAEVSQKVGTREEATVLEYTGMGQVVSENKFFDLSNGSTRLFLARLRQYQRIATSSYTVAVVADSLRIPWKPLTWDVRWQDYFGTLFGLGYSQNSDFILTDEDRLAEVQATLLEDVHNIKEI